MDGGPDCRVVKSRYNIYVSAGEPAKNGQHSSPSLFLYIVSMMFCNILYSSDVQCAHYFSREAAVHAGWPDIINFCKGEERRKGEKDGAEGAGVRPPWAGLAIKCS